MDQYTNVGDFIDRNKIIFKYIYDKFGFRVGIVVAEKGEGRWHPKIGWALFKEVPYTVIVHTKCNQIPAYKDMDDFPFIPVEEAIVSKENKLELFKKAWHRANYNSFSYYVNLNDLDVHRNTVLRSEEPEIWYSDGIYKDKGHIRYANDYYGIIKSLKRSVKDLEFRAYRYFKK